MTLSAKLLALGETCPERPDWIEHLQGPDGDQGMANYALALESLCSRLCERVEKAERPKGIVVDISEALKPKIEEVARQIHVGPVIAQQPHQPKPTGNRADRCDQHGADCDDAY